jgi:hypothetical protein
LNITLTASAAFGLLLGDQLEKRRNQLRRLAEEASMSSIDQSH